MTIANEPNYPIGVQSFKGLREDGCLYIDKTQYIPLLLRNKYTFLSRPRRFGKSLLLSTLEAYFRGQKELFEGLAVYEWEKKWEEYPVVHVDFNRADATDINAVIRSLRRQLNETAVSYGISLPYADNDYDIGDIFSQLLHHLHDKTGRKVVILIDEYDKGIIEVLHDERKRDKATSALRPFFGVMKTEDEHIRYAFVTGVSRFRNTTIFSGSNNFSDISMDDHFAALFGITYQEMVRNFQPAIRAIADKYNKSIPDTLNMLKARYDGYRFTSSRQLVYNPFSLLNAFDKLDLQDYWIASGSSRSLAIYLKGVEFSLNDIISEKYSAADLNDTYLNDSPVSLLFQTGYLTIEDYDHETQEYSLCIPNQEVQRTMSELLLPEFVGEVGNRVINRWLSTLRRSVIKGDIDTMMETFKSLLAAVPYHHIDKVQEKHLHLCMNIVMLLLGVNTRSEVSVSGGRVDMVASTPWRVYVFEFKLDRPAAEALAQINSRGYPLAWTADNRTVYKIGVEFSSHLHTIASWTYTTC